MECLLLTGLQAREVQGTHDAYLHRNTLDTAGQFERRAPSLKLVLIPATSGLFTFTP
jgi:hypothetical protein